MQEIVLLSRWRVLACGTTFHPLLSKALATTPTVTKARSGSDMLQLRRRLVQRLFSVFGYLHLPKILKTQLPTSRKEFLYKTRSILGRVKLSLRGNLSF
ncbi:hypothetical protein FOQG_19260 [Fusarium oxysporum f. sp. raphani 54005]|uniref:Uncharacterized protein n=1 Tax=Fusarium oxysporum f. sp. raphani 54005 TaxID=1089458 RepID=X0BBU1_FUSOX|nr:hypothetical protein FOQG_19260 [Fusarium oxysporum f. sp. raphani 54005]